MQKNLVIVESPAKAKGAEEQSPFCGILTPGGSFQESGQYRWNLLFRWCIKVSRKEKQCLQISAYVLRFRKTRLRIGEHRNDRIPIVRNDEVIRFLFYCQCSGYFHATTDSGEYSLCTSLFPCVVGIGRNLDRSPPRKRRIVPRHVELIRGSVTPVFRKRL